MRLTRNSAPLKVLRGNHLSRSIVRKPAYLALSCVGAFASHPAFANDAPPVPANDEDPDKKADIVVNGQRQRADPKQVAPLIDTPKSIVVLDKSVIEQTGSTSLQDALRTVPGITFGAAEGGNPIGDRPFIRGFDSQGSIYIDGVRDLGSQSREVFAIDSVQIVRGSDSTLGGRGSAGGTINILSKFPTLGTYGSASGSYGNGEYKRVSGDVNVQVSDTAAVRLEALWHDQNIVDRDEIYSRRWGFAPSVTIGLGTPTRLTASYYYLETHELPDSGIPYLYTIGNAPLGNSFTTPAMGTITTAGGQTGTVKRSNFYGLVDRDFRDATSQQATLRVEHDFGGITLRNTARYSYSKQAYIFTLPDDSNGNVFGTTAANTGSNVTTGGYVWVRGNTRYGYDQSLVDQTDLSGKFHTGSIEHSFAAGAEFSWEKTRKGAYVEATGSTITPRCNTATIARFYCTSLFTPNPNAAWVNYTSDTSTITTPIVRGASNTETQNDASTQAVYAFDSITLLPSLILNLGARYDHFGFTVTPPFATGGTAVRLSRSDDLFNWQAGLVFKPTKETSLYASYATSATPPNSVLGEGSEGNAVTVTPTNSAALNQALLDALKVTKTKSYEVGAKGNFLHEKLALGLAVFQTEIQNARVTSDSGSVAFLGETRIRGVELTANGTILPGWTVFGGYTFLDAKVIDGGFTALAVAAVGAAKATTKTVVSVTTGKAVPQTARNSFTMSTNYQAAKRFSFGGGAYYMDKQVGGYADNRAATQDANGVITVTPATKTLTRGIPSYWRFDAQARYALTDTIAISVNAQNLTNKIYYTQAYASHYASIAPGRTVFGTVKVGF
jgi:catecholate siderophore receptor